MEIVWTPTYTAILAAVVSSSLLIVALEPVLNFTRRKRLYRGWQAVFLSNGQVYFGKIKSLTRDDVMLTNIYYLQTQEGNLSKESAEDSPFEWRPEGVLVKLGAEIHRPKDAMVIGRSHILFIENLESKYAPLINAIDEHKEREKRAKKRKIGSTEV